MKRLTLIFSTVMLFVGMTIAQRTITGTVKDAKGESLIGANVSLKGTSIGTTTDVDGSFSIQADNASPILVISYVGFSDQEIVVGSQSKVDIIMQEGVLVQEVVVTATGIRKDAREIGYSYAKVSNDDVVNGKSPQLAQALSGKVAGLAVYNVSNSVDPQAKIVLRGYRSLTG
ncbi:MAG: carboxypeptidase-like regulatory domain-containing protein, partial [Saprospiraceae bacterium]|nr:carboxypeptidase-like regulatory domain-containing protein [Saprospiraceae bacterium]